MKALLVKRGNGRSAVRAGEGQTTIRSHRRFECTQLRRASFNFTKRRLAHSKWRLDDLSIGARGLFELGRLCSLLADKARAVAMHLRSVRNAE
jgi:hypothetical protein